MIRLAYRSLLALLLFTGPVSGGEPAKEKGKAEAKTKEQEQTKGEQEPEAQRRKQFEKVYGSGIKEQQLAALETLRGGKEPNTGKSLYKVFTVSRDPEIRLATFDVLCSLEDPDGSFAHLVALCFRAEREREAKVNMALSMQKMKYKWSALSELCRFAPQLGFPVVPIEDEKDRNRRRRRPQVQGGISRDENYEEILERTLKVREQLVLVLNAINHLSGEIFFASRKTPQEIRAWWRKYNLVVLKHDADRREGKLPKEPSEAAQKEKDGKKNEQAEVAEDAKDARKPR